VGRAASWIERREHQLARVGGQCTDRHSAATRNLSNIQIHTHLLVDCFGTDGVQLRSVPKVKPAHSSSPSHKAWQVVTV